MGHPTLGHTPAARQQGTPAPRRSRAPVVLVGALACAAVVAAVALTDGDGDAGTRTPPGMVDASAVPPPPPVPRHPPGSREAIEEQTKQVLRETERLDRTVWAKEVEAQRHEEFFIRLWDDFRAAEDKFAVLERAAVFESLAWGAPGTVTEHDWGVRFTRYEGAGNSVDGGGWRALLAKLRGAGYRPTELEFHQSAFEHEPGQPARSVVATVVHAVNDDAGSRQALRCKLKVEWAAEAVGGGANAVIPPRAVEVTELTVAERTGPVAFQPVPGPLPSERGFLTTPGHFVLLYDLDADGLSEILIPAENLLLRNRGGWRFEREAILPGANQGLDGPVIADFDGDGLPDLLCSRLAGDVYLIRGRPGGRFAARPGRPAVTLPFKAEAISALTVGDVDGDGDLDAWFGQYKPPYERGQMPTPYYDANDGFPAALLINDGAGHFTDATESAGLAAKRFRRTLAGSLVDLDGDRDLDLLVNSDFAGLDVYYNDGKGRFADATEQVIDERHNFGMGHTFADFNLDGRLDVYTIGMSSTTARRLTSMGLGLEKFPVHQAKRPQMGYGNRMFLAAGGGGPPSAAPARFVQPAFKEEVARTGWSWGTTSPDFDNDGDPDIFVGNGMASGDTCRDYCTTYWRRDIYLGSSREDAVMHNLFAQHSFDPKESWNGFEHDVLFMNEAGRGFVNVAHLMGVAFEFDARNVASDDLDGDGKVDLLVMERRAPGHVNHLHVLRNAWPTRYNWVGVRLAETRPGYAPAGAEVRVRTAGGRVRVGRVVTGDSYHSQHAPARHFGLGNDDAVEAIEVAWPNGEVTRVDRPAVNRWHAVGPAGG